MSMLYLKIIDKEGAYRIEQREAWDEEKFLQSVIRQYGDDEKNPCRVEVVTREDYLRSKK